MDTVITDLDLHSLLKLWKLEHLYNTLKEQDISTDVLKILQPHHISKLFEKTCIGDYARFEDSLHKWKASSTLDTFTTPHTIKQSSVTLSEILHNTFNGKEIFKFYAKNQMLHEEQRNLLITTVAKYMEANGMVGTISDCVEMEKQICLLFPTEKLEFYSNGKRGKIYNKLANLKRLSRGVFKEIYNVEEEALDEQEQNYTITIQQLRRPNITADEFDLYWRKCAQYRLQQFKKTANTAEIFELWPEFKKPSGPALIDIDFELKYSMAKKLENRWSSFGENIIYLLKTKINCSAISKKLQHTDILNEDSKFLTTLWHMHHIFPPTQKIKSDESGAKIRKKFSVPDSQQSFAIIAETQEEIEVQLKLLLLQGRSVSPKLLVCGSLEDIKSISVYFDGYRYPFFNIIKAFDTLFKLFFVFNIKFPEESELFYCFVQEIFYEIPNIKKYSKISTTKHEILKMQN